MVLRLNGETEEKYLVKKIWHFRLPCCPCHSIYGHDKYRGEHLSKPWKKLLSICPGKGNVGYQLLGIFASVEFRRSGFLAMRNLNKPPLPPALWVLPSFCPSSFSSFLLCFLSFTFFYLHLSLFLNKPTHSLCQVKLELCHFWDIWRICCHSHCSRLESTGATDIFYHSVSFTTISQIPMQILVIITTTVVLINRHKHKLACPARVAVKHHRSVAIGPSSRPWSDVI